LVAPKINAFCNFTIKVIERAEDDDDASFKNTHRKKNANTSAGRARERAKKTDQEHVFARTSFYHPFMNGNTIKVGSCGKAARS
jgi:hypothetical protein